MERKNLLKASRIPPLAEILARRCQNVIAERREKQRKLFWGAVIPSDEPVSKKPVEQEKKKITRVEMLQKWKAEKVKKLEEAKKKQKPIFKVGVVQRKATGSPVFSQPRTNVKNNLSNLVRNKCHMKSEVVDLKEKSVGVVTRAKAKKINTEEKQVKGVIPNEGKIVNKFCKIDKNKKVKITSHVFRVPEAVSKLPSTSLTFPCTPELLRRTRRSLAVKAEEKVTEADAHLKDVPKENFISPVKTPETKILEEDDFRPIYYSPFVTVRSGKKSGKKSKSKLAMDVDEQIKKEGNEFKCRIFSFRKFIECETKRLLEACEKWKHIYEEFEEVPKEVEGDIDSIIGKTRLLTSDKLNQFRGLIEKCEGGDPFVKVDDLQGFQDWVALEVERIDEEFHRLERLKGNGWRESREVEQRVQQQGQQRQQRQQTLPSKSSKNARNRPVGRSNIREHILAARKMLKEGLGRDEGKLPQSPVKLKTPKKEEKLLKMVLSAEMKVKKESFGRRNSGLEIMMATQKNKFSTPAKKSPEAKDFEVFFDKENTPNRSILKKTPKPCNSLKARVTFKRLSQKGEAEEGGGGRGLSEKYFRPLVDSDEDSPMRIVLEDLGNRNSGGMKTRSRSRLLLESASPSPRAK